MLFGQLEFVNLAANPFGLIRSVGEEREGFAPFVAGLRKGVLFFELICFRGNADELFAVEQRVALRAIERAEGHRLAAVVTVADGLNDRRRGHGLRLRRSGCGRRRWSAVLERPDDVNFGRARLLPGEANADE